MRKLFTPKNMLIIIAIVAVGLAIFLLVRKTPLPEGLTQVNGRIEGDVVVISSKYSGKIKQLLAREGDDVTKDQMVVRLDDPETRDRLAQSQENFDAVLAQAKSAGYNVGLTAETGGSSIEQARGQMMQAVSDIQSAQASAKSSAANVKNAEAAVRSQAATLRQAEEAIKRYSADLDTAKANWQSASKVVEAAQSQAKLSALNASRFTNLAREGVVTERQRDEYVTAAAKDQAQLQSAQANASSAQAQVASKQSDLNRSRDQVAAAQADLQRAQAQVAASKQELSAANSRVLVAKGRRAQAAGILRQAMTTPTQVAISTSNHASSLAQVREAKAKVAEQQSILNDLFVVAPISGKIVTRIRDNGEVVTAGSPILEAVDLDKLYLKAYVPEKEIGKIRLGLPAKIYVDAYPNQPFDAVVKYISSTAEFTPKEVQTPDERVKLVYAVKLYVRNNPDHRLTPGMPADAIIRWKEGVPWKRPQY